MPPTEPPSLNGAPLVSAPLVSAPLVSAPLISALTRLLRPLVRLLLRAGMTFPQAAELLRGLYVDVASRDLLGSGASDSRVSVLTGVHRKEIRRLREQGVVDAPTPRAVSLNSQIIARWLATDGYVDASGAPLPLPRVGPSDNAPSFDLLVRSVTTDVRPRAVLDEWQRLGIVSLQPDGNVMLREIAYVPRAGEDSSQDDASLYYFGRNLHDHIAAGAANLAAAVPEHLDLSLHYDGLSPAAVAVLRREGGEAARRLLVALNRRAQALAEADAGGDLTAATGRINLGVYLFAETPDADGSGPAE